MNHVTPRRQSRVASCELRAAFASRGNRTTSLPLALALALAGRAMGFLLSLLLPAFATAAPDAGPATAAPRNAAPANAAPATAPSAAADDVEHLPSIPQLPDPFAFNDGSRVRRPEDWPRRRAEIQALVLAYEYGALPPEPAEVRASEIASATTRPAEGVEGTEKQFVLVAGPGGKVRIHLDLTLPPGKGPFPVIVRGDRCWGKLKPDLLALVLRRGYALADFDRTDAGTDKKLPREQIGGAYAAYPDYAGGELAAWAWAFHRAVDFLATREEIDPKRLVITGHSRGGKAALLAGATDQRVAVTIANGSGCGGAGCYRFQGLGIKSEGIASILKNFPYWFEPRFGRFIGHVDRLPIDQHFVKALVAPRALLTTEALDDLWANPQGTQQTYAAAREVYRFLNLPGRIGIHFRPGKHEQNAEDWAALLDFADAQLTGKPPAQPFDRLAFPDLPQAYSWSAPAGTP